MKLYIPLLLLLLAFAFPTLAQDGDDITSAPPAAAPEAVADTGSTPQESRHGQQETPAAEPHRRHSQRRHHYVQPAGSRD